jgi:PAS domain S-box-containing protein
MFSALPEAGRLLLAADPAWVWSLDGSRLLWANPAGGARLGAANFEALAGRHWPPGHPLRREIESLARLLTEKGSLARLRLAGGSRALPIACRCRRLRAGEERGILTIALDSAGERPSLPELASFFSGADSAAAILDDSGAMLAIGAPESSGALALSGAHAEFADGDRRLRIQFLDLTPAPVAAPQPEPPAARAPPLGEPMAAMAVPEEPGVEPRPAAERARREAGEDEKPRPKVPPRVVVIGKPRAETAVSRGTGHPVRSNRKEAAEARASPAPPSPRPEPEPAPAKAGAAPPIGRQLAEPAEKAAPEAPFAEPVSARPIVAGRVARELSRKPVRFLWQTDAADRFLFVSPGLAQVVGRNAEIVGERWQDAAARLRLDPMQRIARALAQRDTWSGQTAWWPVEGSNVRVPTELTALPVYGGDRSFQGYRGFGVLRPAEALMPAAFEARFGTAEQPPPAPAEQLPPYEEAAATTPANVVPIRADLERMIEQSRLTPQERSAFEEIAAALKQRVVGEGVEPALPAGPPSVCVVPEAPPAAPEPPANAEPASALAPVPAEPAPRRTQVSEGEAQRRLREMTAILDTATDGVVILDAAGRIESVNASAEALFGLDANELRGTDFGELLTPESRQAALDYLSSLADNGVASLLNEGREVGARAGTGSIALFMTMGRISGENGGRYCAVLRDITHWKRTEAELVAARRAAETASNQKSEFLARVSHEIRTPLNAIIGFAEVMIEERFGPIENERYREYLRDIRTSGEHVVSLVNDLLDISKIEAGKLDLNFVAVPLNELVRECIQLMQPQANRAHVVLRSSLSRDVPAIVADQRTMRQIVLNLLSNSVKFTSPGGQVIASTSLAESGEALLRIRDTGEGMSEEELQRALEPFRQIATTTLADRTGTGLGLPLTKALVEANRATLSIRSARGEGTVVTIAFPPTRVLSE